MRCVSNLLERPTASEMLISVAPVNHMGPSAGLPLHGMRQMKWSTPERRGMQRLSPDPIRHQTTQVLQSWERWPSRSVPGLGFGRRRLMSGARGKGGHCW